MSDILSIVPASPGWFAEWSKGMVAPVACWAHVSVSCDGRLVGNAVVPMISVPAKGGAFGPLRLADLDAAVLPPADR